MALLLLAMLWIGIQIAPITPVSWHHPIWSLGGDALGVALPGRVSIDPQAGIFALIRLVAYAAIFFLALQYGRDPDRARLGLQVFTVASAAAAGLGLVIWGLGFREFLWFDADFIRMQTRHGARLAIPFVNPNHLASFAGMGLICGVGLLAGEAGGLWRPETARREKLRRFFDSVLARRWYLMASCMVLAAAVLLSASRGGLLVAVLGLLALTAGLLRRSRPRIGALAAGFLVAALALASVFAPTLARVADRVATSGLETDQRIAIYGNTLKAIGASPWLGYGYGGFPSLYRFYDSGDLTRVVEAAHSTVLETVAELGIPAALALFVAVLFPIVLCWRGTRARRRDQHFPAIGAAVGVAVCVHALVDFPLQIPAIAAAFSFILGLSTAQSTSSRVS
jgi:O-antigen ligase